MGAEFAWWLAGWNGDGELELNWDWDLEQQASNPPKHAAEAVDGACHRLQQRHRTRLPLVPSAHGRRSGICTASRRDQPAERRDLTWTIAT
jgi:hypothetical protein